MNTTLEIKWIGNAGYGVVTTVNTLAAVIAEKGRYVQSMFLQSIHQRGMPVMGCNRISTDPIRTHSWIEKMDVVAIINSPQFFLPDIVNDYKENTTFILNSTVEPEIIIKKYDLKGNPVYTLDANTISREEIGGVRPGICILSIVLNHLKLISIETFKSRLKDFLSIQLEPPIVEGNLRSVDRALSEVNVP